ncbi:cell division protein SepF [Enterococcus sp. AZ109]|uniref:cell division protein SepF n=1 Tax=Enterococcus sp. AZ109 TaxID=2774634 RepID=UPI003F23AFFA
MAINLARISDFFGLADEEEIYEEPIIQRQPIAKQPKREKRAKKQPMVNSTKQQIRKEPVKRIVKSEPAPVSQTMQARQPEKVTIKKSAVAPSIIKTDNVVSMPKNEAMKKRTASQTTTATKTRSRISVVEPKAYNEAMVIAKRIAQGEAVFINFHSIDEGRARRIVDFLTGTVYMIDGDIKRVGNEMFLCTPTNMEVDNSALESIGDQDIFGLEL